MKLILLHGRSQQNFEETKLKKDWIDALNEGLRESNLTLGLSDDDIIFPYYGKMLINLIDNPEDYLSKVVEKGNAATDGQSALFISQLLEDIMRNADLTDEEVLKIAHMKSTEKGALNWPWIQAILRAMDSRNILDQATLWAFTKDVFCYLKDNKIRRTIDEFVSQFIPEDEQCVWVSHSLGTVISYNVLSQYEGENIKEIITVGSPLGLNAIKKNLRSPLVMPSCSINGWYNAYDKKDVVSLFPLEKPYFSTNPAIINNGKVLNDTDNKHGISGYLKDKEVALRIYNAIHK